MTTRNLEKLFKPRSVAVIGASTRPGRVGAAVWKNLRAGGFQGPIWPVNPAYESIDGVPCFADVDHLPEAPDLAVLCTRPATIPDLIRQVGERGTRAATVITALREMGREDATTLTGRMLAAAKPFTLRILGPNCVGLLVPGIGLNASFAAGQALAGKLAFVSQSGALVTAVLDWAGSQGIGFSHFVSLGDAGDVDFGDLIDYLGADAQTSAILIYMESVKASRKFMSAARAAARNKPVVIVKSGRAEQGARAAASHTGAMLGSDAVYDAAIRRAGMLRVCSTEDLFTAVTILANSRPLNGEGLAIVTNGGGPGVMAVDELVAVHMQPAEFAPETIAALDLVLPPTWSRANPADVIGDADAERYVAAVSTVLRDPAADALLVIHAPTAIVSSAAVAQALAPLIAGAGRNVMACWMGGSAVAAARACLEQAHVPTYATPEQAVHAFAQMVQYRRNQQMLMEVPALLGASQHDAAGAAGTVIRAVLEQGRAILTEPEAKAVLSAYGVPVVQTRIVGDADEAVQAAAAIGFPVALKILSAQIVHKTDVGGVILELEDGAAVRAACEAMLRRVAESAPGAHVDGFTVQAMARRPEAHELFVGAAVDPVFGPVVMFGQGGIAVEALDDHVVALPPLNQVLARDLVSRARVARLLRGYRGRTPADHDAIHRVLIAVGQMLADIPEIVALDVNPLLADQHGVLALDARIEVAPAQGGGVERFAIVPYPQHLEQVVAWDDGRILVRPIRPEDAPAHVEFFESLDPVDVRTRFMTTVRALTPRQLARFTQIDYDREMAFIASRQRAGGGWETLGVARSHADPDRVYAEFAVIVRSELKSKGLGGLLMSRLIEHCRNEGIGELRGEVLVDNKDMLQLARRLGFRVDAVHDGVVEVIMDLQRS